MVRAFLYIFSCYIFDFGAFWYKQHAFFEARQSWLGLGEGMNSPEFIYLIQDSKIHSTGLPRYKFLAKYMPLPPLKTTHGAAVRKIFDEKEAHDDEDFKTGCENVLASMVLSQFKKQIWVKYL